MQDTMGIRLRALAPESDEMMRLDALRFLAAMAIVFYHFRLQLVLDGTAEQVSNRLAGLEAAVDLFFFISGFVITRFYGGLNSARSYGQFVWKRLSRLYPLHLATMLSFIAIGVGATVLNLPLKQPKQFDAACIPDNLLLVQSLGFCRHPSLNLVSWSISAEMLLYLLFPVVILLRRRPAFLLLVAFTWFAVLALSPHNAGWTSWTYDGGFVRAVPSFLFGAACFGARGMLAKVPAAAMATWLTALLIVVAILAGAPGEVVVPMTYVTAALAIGADRQGPPARLTRWAAAGGTLTYSLYMLHPLVDIVFISMVGKKLLGLGGGALNAWVGLAVLVALAASYVSWQFFEMPLRRRIAALWPARRSGHETEVESKTPL